jgi:hypothetical protein
VKRGRRRKAGRPSLLTPALTQKICSMIIAGAYDYAAAEACGISKDTFREWMARGEGHDKDRESRTRFAAFAVSIRLARSQARVGAEVVVKKTDPKWWLSRMYRDRPGEPGWTRGEHIEVSGAYGGAITVELSEEETEERLSILAQAVKILKDLGVEYEDPEAIEVLPVKK